MPRSVTRAGAHLGKWKVVFLLRRIVRGSRVIFFLDPSWRRGFHLPSQVPDEFVIFFFDTLIFFDPLPIVFFDAVNISF